MSDFNGPPGFFSGVPIFFIIVAGIMITIISVMAYGIIKGLRSWSSNNAAEIVTQRCKVVDKRTEVWGGSGDSSANTNYYITFEFQDNTRKELHVQANYYGLITVGDQGELTYQGTRFKEFIRQIANRGEQ